MRSRPRSRIEEGEELRLRARHLRRRLRDIMGGSLEAVESVFEGIESEYLYIRGRMADLEKTKLTKKNKTYNLKETNRCCHGCATGLSGGKKI